MDLDETQRYAAAGLFTTLLHAKQLEAGVAGDADAVEAEYHPWGEPASSQHFSPSSAESTADSYWGRDCSASGGLCERVYQHLQVPKSKWAALKQLPQVFPAVHISLSSQFNSPSIHSILPPTFLNGGTAAASTSNITTDS